jgi:hypothetical protein
MLWNLLPHQSDPDRLSVPINALVFGNPDGRPGRRSGNRCGESGDCGAGAWQRTYDDQLKFVVRRPEDIDEIRRILQEVQRIAPK